MQRPTASIAAPLFASTLLGGCGSGPGEDLSAAEVTSAAATESSGASDPGGTAATTTGGPAFTCAPQPLTALGKGFFRDVSDASGIRVDNFLPDPPQPIPINDHSRLAFADLDGDGLDDVVAHSLFPNPQAGVPFEHLVYLNQGDGTFRHFSDESGLRDVQAGFFAFGDVDNDGDQDVFAGLDIDLPPHTSALYLNDGQGVFAARPDSGLEDADLAANAVFADFNGDARLDLFVGRGQTSYAAADQLFFGRGDGTFQDVTAVSMPGGPAQPSNGSVACDYDDDGDLDIFVSTYGVSVLLGHNHLWENDGTGRFTEVGVARGLAAQVTGNYWLASTGMGQDPEPDKAPDAVVGSNGFGIACDDVSGDGRMDIFLTAISHPVSGDYGRKWSDPSQLLVGGPDGAFTNEFLARGLPFNEGDVDGGIADFDNDGRLDLSVSRDAKYEGAYSELDQLAWFGLMHQQPDGSFASVGPISGVNDSQADPPRMKQAQNHAWADVDRDGDLDLLVGGRDTGGGRPNFLFENTRGQDNMWLSLRLVGDGERVNRDAIGARVRVRYDGGALTREVRSGRGTYNSHDTRALHFGLGDLGCDFELEVRWPDGAQETFTPEQFPVNAHLTLTYGAGPPLAD